MRRMIKTSSNGSGKEKETHDVQILEIINHFTSDAEHSPYNPYQQMDKSTMAMET